MIRGEVEKIDHFLPTYIIILSHLLWDYVPIIFKMYLVNFLLGILIISFSEWKSRTVCFHDETNRNLWYYEFFNSYNELILKKLV